VENSRDLGHVDVWEESLKRSLERRGRPRRSSVELYRLRPARDLTLGDVLERSSHYSELRRRAAQRPAMPRPSVAIGGISAIALVAGSTLPSLLGGGRAAKKERVSYAADVHTRARAEAAVRGTFAGSADAGATHTAVSRYATRTASGSAHAPASKTTSNAAAASVAPVTSSGGSGLASASSVKGGGASIRLVSDHTSNVPPAVSAVQQVQQRLGVDPVDGSYGAMTEQAVTQFQASHGLEANGVVGTATRKALGIGPGPTLHPDAVAADPVPAAAPAVVRERQATPTTTVHSTGGVPMQTVSTVTQTHAGPTHVGPTHVGPTHVGPTHVGPTDVGPTPEGPTPAGPTHVPPTHVRPTHDGTPSTQAPTDSTQPTPGGSVQSGVQRMIAAGNRIATRPYVYGGGHGSFNSRGYDCSGSVSYVLHAAGLLKAPMDSTELESYGRPGPGRYVSIYANSGHAWMTIQGRRFDTVARAQTGSRWSNHMASTSGFVVRHPTHY
jgi:peptidoglycan hydrolase-like protein with peptidoglycan-binding domain